MDSKFIIEQKDPGLYTVKISNIPSWYDPASSIYGKELLHLVNKLNSIDQEKPLVLVIQDGPLEDWSAPNWHKKLESTYYRTEIFNHLSITHQIMQSIFQSRVPWYYLSNSNCQGSFFELALACQFRLWFDRNVWVGFPEAERGFFPSLLTWEFYRPIIQEVLENKSSPLLFLTKDAALSGFIHRAINMPKWQNIIEQSASSWKKTKLTEFFKRNMEEPHKKGRYFRFFKEKALWESSPEHGGELERYLLKSNYLEKYLNILRKRGRVASEIEFLNSKLDLASSQYFDPLYLNYLKTESQTETKEDSLEKRDLFVIDVTSSAPPKGAILKLIQSKKNLFLTADEAEDLVKGLEIFYYRITQLIQSQKSPDYWKSNVWWGSIKELKHPNVPLFTWFADQFLQLKVGGKSYQLVHLFRSLNSYEPSSYELYTDGNTAYKKDDIVNLSSLIAEKVFYTKALGKTKLALSIVSRLFFLNHMVLFASTKKLSLEKLITALETTGWTYPAEINNWDNFLAFLTDDFYPQTQAEIELAAAFNYEPITTLSWKRLRTELTVKEVKTQTIFTPMEVNYIFSCLSFLLVLFLSRCDTSLTLNEIDLLVQKSLGAPLRQVSPIQFFSAEEPAKIYAFLVNEWPKAKAAIDEYLQALQEKQ